MKYAMLYAAVLVASCAMAQQRPNIVMIVADDMGYADCGAYGCADIPTPHIDALAKAGVRFTDGYVTGTVCSPTRASLMTGRYHYRDGVTDWIPEGKRGMNAGVPTVAQYLKKAGYRTAIVGKWHLGEAEECRPPVRGFDTFYGFLGGHRDYFPDKPPAPGDEGKVNSYTQMMRDNSNATEAEYTTHAFGREAAAFVAQQKGRAEPFFLYLAFNAVHLPLQAPQDYLDRFAPIDDKPRRTYAAMLSAMDDAVGRVSDAIAKAGFADSTLVCFISDNGGPIMRNGTNASRNTPLRGGKAETWEGGIRVPFIMKWKGGLPQGATYAQPVINMDLTATFLALAGVTPDAQWPLDGVNLMPFLKGGAAGAPHETLCWEYGQQWAIRQGDWKLVCARDYGQKDSERVTALYNLAQDISEADDRLAAEPERVKRMQEAWRVWRGEVLGKQKAAKVDVAKAIAAP